MRPAKLPEFVDPRATGRVLGHVASERLRQDTRWGEQNHPDGTTPGQVFLGIFGGQSMASLRDLMRAQVDYDAKRGASTWAGILLEEVLEAMAEDDPQALRTELLQVAAVAVSWVEAIDRRTVQ